jgi:prefoldin beta subunit
MTTAKELMLQLEEEVKEFRKIQKEIENLTISKQKLLTQLNENEMVLKELGLAGSDSTIYKLVGPILVKQEKQEAVTQVNNRIEFINGEIKRLEFRSKELEKKQTDQRQKVIELQRQLKAQTQVGIPKK